MIFFYESIIPFTHLRGGLPPIPPPPHVEGEGGKRLGVQGFVDSVKNPFLLICQIFFILMLLCSFYQMHFDFLLYFQLHKMAIVQSFYANLPISYLGCNLI